MIILNTSNKSLAVILGGAPTTTQLEWSAHFVEMGESAYAPASTHGQTAGVTPVTMVPAPADNHQRQVKALTVYNADTVEATVRVRLVDAGTPRTLISATLVPGATLVYSDGEGFRVMHPSGGIQQTTDLMLFDNVLQAFRTQGQRIGVEGSFSWQRAVLDLEADPPGAPNKGDRYLVIPAATGAWAGREDTIAWWDGTQWQFDGPFDGWAVISRDDGQLYTFFQGTWGLYSELITSVGALNAGSITSGFGDINIGSSTFTTSGLTTVGSLTFSGGGPNLVRIDDDTLSQQRGTNSQGMRWYNTVDGAGFEYGGVSFNNDEFRIFTFAGGTGLARDIILRTSSTNRWAVGATSGHFTAQGNFAVRAGDGSAGAPAFAFGSAHNTGFYLGTATSVRYSAGGSVIFAFDGGGAQFSSGSTLRWSSGAVGGASDVVLARDAADTLALRRGANAQRFNIYNTFTDASNHEHVALAWDSNEFRIQSSSGGTGSTRDIVIRTAGVNRWRWTGAGAGAGHFLPAANNTYDIGSSSALIRNFFAAGADIRLTGLPTNASGLATGQLWNDGGTVKVVT